MDFKQTFLWMALSAPPLMSETVTAHAVTRFDRSNLELPCTASVVCAPARAHHQEFCSAQHAMYDDRVLSLLQLVHERFADETGPHWRQRWQKVDPLLSEIDRLLEAGSGHSKPLS